MTGYRLARRLSCLPALLAEPATGGVIDALGRPPPQSPPRVPASPATPLKYSAARKIVPINGDEFLSDERDGKDPGDNSTAVFKRFYRIDLRGAQEESGITGDTRLAGHAVAKTLFLDVAGLKVRVLTIVIASNLQQGVCRIGNYSLEIGRARVRLS